MIDCKCSHNINDQGCSMFVTRCKTDTPTPVTTREGLLSTQYSVRSRCNKLLTSTNCSTSISIIFISTLQFLSLSPRNIYYIVNCPCSKFYGVTFYIIYFIILWRYLLYYLYCYFKGSPFTLFIFVVHILWGYLLFYLHSLRSHLFRYSFCFYYLHVVTLYVYRKRSN